MNFYRFGFFLFFFIFFINIVFSLTNSDEGYIAVKNKLLLGEESVQIIVALTPDSVKNKDDKNNSKKIFSKKEIKSVQDKVKGKLKSKVKEDKILKKAQIMPFIVMEINSSNVDDLLSISEISSIREDEVNRLFLTESLPIIGADTTYSQGYLGTGQAVAILDSGFDKNHDMLNNGKIVSEACYSTNNAVSTSVCPGGVSSSTAEDSALPCNFNADCFHGTHVAGIAVGDGSLLKGVAPGSDLIGIQVGSNIEGDLGIYDSDIILALERVYELTSVYEISAVSMSIGSTAVYGSYCDGAKPTMKAAIDALKDIGIPVIISSGNEYSSVGISSPACISTAISVGSTGDTDVVSSFSNSDDILDILAPGENIISSYYPGGGYASASGTSMAAPHVSGAWSVLRAENVYATYDELFEALNSTGTPITDARNSVTRVRINLDSALDTVLIPPFEGGPNVLNITIEEYISEDTSYNPLNGGETQNSFFAEGFIRVQNVHSTEAVENILIDFSSVSNIYNVTYVSGNLGYVLDFDSVNLNLKIPTLGAGRTTIFRYDINTSSLSAPLNFSTSYLQNKILAGYDLTIYDDIQNIHNSLCLYDINISQRALTADVNGSFYNFTFDESSLTGSDFTNASFLNNRTLIWNVLNSSCLDPNNVTDISYNLEIPSNISVSDFYDIINSTITYKFNDSFSGVAFSRAKAYVDLDLQFDKSVIERFGSNNATWQILAQITNPTNITVNLEKVSLWVSERNATGTGFTNPSVYDQDISSGDDLVRNYFPHTLLNNTDGVVFNNTGSEWTFNYTYSSSPIIWLNAINSIIDNDAQIVDRDFSFSSDSLYLKEVYVASGYWLEISKNVTRLSQENYSVYILVRNLGTSVTPPNQIVVIYNFLPFEVNLTSSFVFSESTWYTTDETNESLNDDIYNGTMYQFAITPQNNPFNASLDKFIGTYNSNNTWSVSFNVSGLGEYSFDDLFLTGLDPLHVNEYGATESIDLRSVYKIVSSKGEFLLMGIALVIGMVLILY